MQFVNERHKKYNSILEQIDISNEKLFFAKKSKLIICLIEFRSMLEIKYVINALLKSYKAIEIGLAVVGFDCAVVFIVEVFG